MKPPNGEFGLAASWGVLRGEAARAEGVAGALPSLPRSAATAGGSSSPFETRAQLSGALGRAPLLSEVKRLRLARVSRRRDSRRDILRVPGAPRGGPVGGPRPGGHKGWPRWGRLASCVRLHLADRVRAGCRRAEGQAMEGQRGLQSAWGRTSGSHAAVRAATLVVGNRRVTASWRPCGRCFPDPVNAYEEESKAAHFLSLRLPLSSVTC